MATESIMNGCERCPQCFQMPTLGFDDDFKTFTIHCPAHGNEAMGDNLEMALKHWNKLINFKRREAYQHIADAPMSKPDESFCIHCQRYTGTLVIQTKILYKAECRQCHLLKFQKLG